MGEAGSAELSLGATNMAVPVWDEVEYFAEVHENIAPGTEIIQVSGSDADFFSPNNRVRIIFSKRSVSFFFSFKVSRFCIFHVIF